MPKFCIDAAMDALLANIATCTRLVICSALPANYAGIAAVALADVTLTAGDGNGDYVIANGASSGRKLTIGVQNGMTIDASGNATHVILDDGTTLRYATTCVTTALTATEEVNAPAWTIEISDPS